MKLESCYTMLVLILNISSKAECLTKRWFYYAKVSRRVQGLQETEYVPFILVEYFIFEYS